MKLLHEETATPAPTDAQHPQTAEVARRWAAIGVGWAHRYGEPTLWGAATLGVLATIWAALVYAPTDADQGDVQRLLYIHVPLAIIPYAAFFVVCVASIVYLVRRDERWDWVARACAEVGVVFTTLTLALGMLWGQAYWGRPWDWADPRLTSTFVLWFIYVSYLLLRFYTGRSESGARLAAVLGIVGFVDVPIVHYAVTWWRSIHPDTDYLVQSNGQSALPSQALLAFVLGMVTFSLLCALLALQVYRIERMQATLQRARESIEHAADAD